MVVYLRQHFRNSLNTKNGDASGQGPYRACRILEESKGWYSMPELDTLREAEEQSRRLIDEARKDAQRTRLGIRAKLDAMDLEKNNRLKNVADDAEAAVETEMNAFGVTLEEGITRQQKYLESRESQLEQSAAEMLRQIITGGAEGD